MTSKLTVAKIKALAKPGLYGDGGTLYLCVAKGRSKSWVQRVVIGGKRREIGLGGFPVLTLAEARDKALDNRRAIARGRDPLAEKRKAAVPTFRDSAQATAKAKTGGLRSSTAMQWIGFLDRYAMTTLGDRRIDEIEQPDVLRVLTPIWTAKAATARKVRNGIRETFSWAQAHQYIQHNPAGEAIDGALPKSCAAKTHHRALPHAEVADALASIEASGASRAAKGCFRFTILTATRSGEARDATWDEIDMEAGTWTVPASRMKAKRDHKVPLSAAALAVLEQARELTDDSGLVFPSPKKRGAPLSNRALMILLEGVGLADRATVHGFRSSFRDWCADSGKPRELAEAALAYTVGGVEGGVFPKRPDGAPPDADGAVGGIRDSRGRGRGAAPYRWGATLMPHEPALRVFVENLEPWSLVHCDHRHNDWADHLGSARCYPGGARMVAPQKSNGELSNKPSLPCTGTFKSGAGARTSSVTQTGRHAPRRPGNTSARLWRKWSWS